MKVDEILRHKPKVLTQDQREFYFENGYLLLESIVTKEWLDILRKTTDEKINNSRKLTVSDEIYDLL